MVKSVAGWLEREEARAFHAHPASALATAAGPPPSATPYVARILRQELERGVDGHVAERVMQRLYEALWPLIGSAGFDVLLARSVALARNRHPILAGISIASFGGLQGLDDASRDRAALDDGAAEIVARFMGLLVALIGEELSIRLVSNVWPRLEDDLR